MKKWQMVLVGAVVLALPVFFAFYGLGLFKVTEPLREDIKRDVFENTKSYLHGVQQDLGKYYLEHRNGSEDEKAAIKATILMRFAEVDADKLQSPQLRSFLTDMRGD